MMAKGESVARKLGWQAQVAGTSFDADADQIARAYGYASSKVWPAKVRSEAVKAFIAGKREERVEARR